MLPSRRRALRVVATDCPARFEWLYRPGDDHVRATYHVRRRFMVSEKVPLRRWVSIVAVSTMVIGGLIGNAAGVPYEPELAPSPSRPVGRSHAELPFSSQHAMRLGTDPIRDDLDLGMPRDGQDAMRIPGDYHGSAFRAGKSSG
jgi:hypothetical protein